VVRTYRLHINRLVESQNAVASQNAIDTVWHAIGWSGSYRFLGAGCISCTRRKRRSVFGGVCYEDEAGDFDRFD